MLDFHLVPLLSWTYCAYIRCRWILFTLVSFVCMHSAQSHFDDNTFFIVDCCFDMISRFLWCDPIRWRWTIYLIFRTQIAFSLHVIHFINVHDTNKKNDDLSQRQSPLIDARRRHWKSEIQQRETIKCLSLFLFKFYFWNWQFFSMRFRRNCNFNFRLWLHEKWLIYSKIENDKGNK